VYLIKYKSKTFEKFRAFRKLVENETNNKIHILKIHKGGEYCSNGFNDFCKENGIKHGRPTPYIDNKEQPYTSREAIEGSYIGNGLRLWKRE